MIEDGTFEGAQDDGLNVHGTHLRVVGMGMRGRGGLGLGGGLGGGGWWEGEGNPAGLISSSSSSSSSGSSSSSSNNNNNSSSSNNTMLVVQFEHPETYGFVSLRPGDALQVLTYLLTYLLVLSPSSTYSRLPSSSSFPLLHLLLVGAPPAAATRCSLRGRRRYRASARRW